VDFEPDVVTPEYVDSPYLWRRIMPRFIKREVGPERKAMEEMEAHMESVDSYLDDLVRRRLTREGVDCATAYDLFAFMIKKFTQMTTRCDPADVSNKQLETVRFLMFDVVAGISMLLFDLVKKTGDRLNIESIERSFDQLFPSRVIRRINRRHGEVTTLESATDCFLFGVTKTVVPQQKAVTAQSRNKKHTEITDPAYRLHSSMCMVNAYNMITKSAPSARESINHFLQLGPHGEVIMEDAYADELANLDEMLSVTRR
jgi:hypothetical protein